MSTHFRDLLLVEGSNLTLQQPIICLYRVVESPTPRSQAARGGALHVGIKLTHNP
jgi:hypothetical protein